MAIAKLTVNDAETSNNRHFLHELREAGFEGEIDRSRATSTVLATDNSIYQCQPVAAVFPRHVEDVRCIAALLGQQRFRTVTVAPRGGGTGTNGQSLTNGIVVDLSRHMNRILSIDPDTRTARVQAGVVKDQLNAELKRHGLFFAPELSTSNRATIGGMISTDASGQGSCAYGKTRNHVLELNTILLGGESLSSKPCPDTVLDMLCARDDAAGRVHRAARDIHEHNKELIQRRFPRLNRCLTGYDLAHLRNVEGLFDLNSVLCGSEGTLGFVVEATLNVLPIPRHAVLINIGYESFMDALRDARTLMVHHPLSIETIDSTVLKLARDDMVWHSVAEFFPDGTRVEGNVDGINLVEFSGDDIEDLRARVAAFLQHISSDNGVGRLGHTVAGGAEAIGRIYAMRKRAVGILGNIQGESRPQPFVEDTVVPPENLPDYIAEFRALLDRHGLRYGMFGHVDAGVLHVRPALNMRDPRHAALVRPISDQVKALTIKYGGLLWGEHGKGVRSEYVPEYFGPLYPSLRQLKAAFDPYNQLNPGKIATPAGSEADLLRIDTTTMRGELDRRIDERVWRSYTDAVHCNGNGACYNFDPDDAMCPSWKATRERIHSPKGRASLLREWLRQQTEAGVDLASAPTPAPFVARFVNSILKRRGETDFSHQVYAAMSGCLACKSCAGQCPVKVNVPEFRSRFLELYHTRYSRPLRDHLIGSLESTIPRFAALPGGERLYNALVRNRLATLLLRRLVGIVDSPLLSGAHWAESLVECNAAPATPERLASLTADEREHSVILVQDTFTRYFDTPVATAFLELATRLGYQIFVAPLLPNGKPLHVQGFLPAFHRAARRSAAQLSALAASDIPLVGLDPAMTLVYRQEYRKVPEIDAVPNVLLPQEWLQSALRTAKPARKTPTAFRLLPHCTERTNAGTAAALWKKVFEAAGLNATMPASGCCGMSGTYGHEARNRDTSAIIFSQSWARHVHSTAPVDEVLATGYSCRCQVKRMVGDTLRHPIQALLDVY